MIADGHRCSHGGIVVVIVIGVVIVIPVVNNFGIAMVGGEGAGGGESDQSL